MARANRANQNVRPSADEQLPMPMRKPRHGKRYLYDDGHDDGQSELSAISFADMEGLSGFVMAPCEDDLSEITDKMHNLTRCVGHRKYPRHHSKHSTFYRGHQYQFHQPLNRCQEEGKEEPYWHIDTNRRSQSARYLDVEEALSSCLAEDAVVALQFSTTNASHARPFPHNDNDYEIPTNRREARSRASASNIENERSALQRRIVTGDIDSVDVTSCFSSGESCAASHGTDGGSSGIGIPQPDNKAPSFYTGCLPSWGALSRWVFLLGCTLSLWLAVEQLSVAKEQPLASLGVQRSRRLQGGPMIRGSMSLPALEPLKLSSVDSNAAWLEPGFVVNATISRGPDLNGISSESLPWESLTLDQEETALEMGFTKPVESSSSSNRQDPPQSEPQSETQPEAETELESTKLPLLALTSEESHQNATQGIFLSHTIHGVGGLNNGVPREEASTQTSPSSTALPPNDTIAPSDEATSSNSTIGQDNPQEVNMQTVIFRVNGGSPVTKTMVIAFAASLCFTTVGIVEWVQHDLLFLLALTLGGVLGLISAMFQEWNPLVSQVLHIVSVQSFLAFAAAILWLRCRQQRSSTPTNIIQPLNQGRNTHKTKEEALMLADFFFALGAVIEVVASYATLSFETAIPPLEIFRAEVFSAAFWVVSALIYLVGSCGQS